MNVYFENVLPLMSGEPIPREMGNFWPPTMQGIKVCADGRNGAPLRESGLARHR